MEVSPTSRRPPEPARSAPAHRPPSLKTDSTGGATSPAFRWLSGAFASTTTSERVLAAVLAIAMLADSLSLRTSAVEVAAVALAAGVIGTMAAMRVVAQPRVPLEPSMFALLTLVAVNLARIPFTSGSHLDASTDAVVMALPAAMALVIADRPTGRQWSGSVLPLVATLAGASSTLAWLSAGQGARFDPPHVLFVALCWSLLLMSGAERKTDWPARLAGLAGLALVLGLTFGSRSRTGLVTVLVMGVLGLLLMLRFRNFRPAVLFVAAVTSLILGAALATTYSTPDRSVFDESAAQQLRLRELLSGELDGATQTRVDEIQDVTDTARAEWTPVEVLIGAGHGATFEPRLANVPRNIGPSGRVHNIHLSPLMVLYRYGVIGLLVIGWMLLQACRGALRTGDTADTATLLLPLALAGFLADSFARNTFVDPTFALFIALGVINTRAR